VQVLLKRGGAKYLPRGFDVAEEIGTYGPVVVKGVKRFQHDEHLKADGIVGLGTFTHLERRFGR
jgi:peptidoglycan hydrolase-like protein with peptidoglycan-binding domain